MVGGAEAPVVALQLKLCGGLFSATRSTDTVIEIELGVCARAPLKRPRARASAPPACRTEWARLRHPPPASHPPFAFTAPPLRRWSAYAAATAEAAGAALVFAAIRARATAPPSPPSPLLWLAVLCPRRRLAARQFYFEP